MWIYLALHLFKQRDYFSSEKSLDDEDRIVIKSVTDIICHQFR